MTMMITSNDDIDDKNIKATLTKNATINKMTTMMMTTMTTTTTTMTTMMMMMVLNIKATSTKTQKNKQQSTR